MKKFLFTILIALSLCGTMFATACTNSNNAKTENSNPDITELENFVGQRVAISMIDNRYNKSNIYMRTIGIVNEITDSYVIIISEDNGNSILIPFTSILTMYLSPKTDTQ